MDTRGNVARKDEFYPIFPEWEEAKEWARKVFTRDRVAEATLTGVTVIILGVLFYALGSALNNYTITGY
ncbi:MAG: hypothetical protein AB1640_09050 [bacterium]